MTRGIVNMTGLAAGRPETLKGVLEVPLDTEMVIPCDSGSTPCRTGSFWLRLMTDVTRSVAATCSVPNCFPARLGITTDRVLLDSETDWLNALDASWRDILD